MSVDFLVLDAAAADMLLADYTAANPGPDFWEARYPLRWFVGPGLIEDWANGHFKQRLDQAPLQERETLLPGIWAATLIELPDVRFLLDCCTQDLRRLRLAEGEKDRRLSSNLHRLLPLLLEASYQGLPIFYWP